MSVYKSRLSNKMLIILIILCLSVIFFSIFYKKEDNLVSTFKEENFNNKTYTINLEGMGITTRNLDMFNTNEIVGIIPDISIKYNKIVDFFWYDIDNTKSFSSNINKLEEYYKNVFNRNGIQSEYINIEYNGLGIKKLKVITDNIEKYSKYKIED